MGTITILPETTQHPITLIGRRAGVCWGADISDDKKNYKRGMDCILANHGRTLEFVNVEMIIDGYSAKVIREFYTHIGSLPSRLQASTRYIDYSKGDGFSYTIPHSIEKNEEALSEWKSFMSGINFEIQNLINNHNIPVEDATMLLPIAYSTKMVDKRNLRNLVDMSRNRMCSRAYWEYRELFNDICKALSEISDEWKWIVKNLFKPKCEQLGYCTEKKSCGRKDKRWLYINKKRRKFNEFDLSEREEIGTAILIYNDKKYYFDLEDYELISKYYWKPNNKDYLAHWYALYDENGKRHSKYIYFHKCVLGLNDSPNKVDHIDRDNHNNRKQNLRECTHQENIYNSSIGKNNTSGIIGVNFNKTKGTWAASLMKNGKHVYTKNSVDKSEAIRNRLLAEIKYFGKEFAPQRHLFSEYLKEGEY